VSVFCRYHCRGHPYSGCDSHFTSLEAFDLHRAGDHAAKRFCVPPDDVDRLTVETRDGVCRLTRGIPERRGIVIYGSRRHARDRSRMRQRLRGSESRPARAEGDQGAAA
jgi:hypothetical protein